MDAPCQMQNYQIDPQMVEKFNEIDKDKSGTLNDEELYNAYKYSRTSKIDDLGTVRMLMGAVTDKDIVTMEEFTKFD